MATKWKNIIETGKRLLKQHWQVLVSVMLAGCGIFTFYILIAYRTYYPTEKILYFGILGNILLGSGTAYLLEKGLNRKYQNWIPKEDAYYREWRAEMKKMEHLLQVIGILAFAAAGIFFVLQSKFREYWSWYYNYAAGYVMLFTALLQYMVWQFVRRRFDEKKREVLMGKLEEINQKRIAEALENEKKSLAKVSRSDQLRIDLITNVSHDLKTPLTSIINYVDLMKRENPTDPKIQEYLRILDEKSQRLKVLTEDVVEASKASTGNIKLEMNDIDFVEMVQQVIGEFEEKFQEKNLTMMVHFTDEPSIIYADGQRMWRVLENVFGNVVKYAMEGTRVYAEISNRNKKVTFSLKNISAQPLNISADELTERFIRGDVARNTEGSGLGLSIAKSLTELQGGEFKLYLDGDLFKVMITFVAKNYSK